MKPTTAHRKSNAILKKNAAGFWFITWRSKDKKSGGTECPDVTFRYESQARQMAQWAGAAKIIVEE